MINILKNLSTLKKFGIILLIIFPIISYGFYKVYDYHISAIETAVSNTQNELLLERERLINERESELLEIAEIEKEELEERISDQNKKLSELEKMLLIDHDLDRLLQEHPDMILKRVNEGTKQYYDNLEKVTNE